MYSIRKITLIYLLVVFLLSLAGTTQAKSLYVITRHFDNIITAYDIQGQQIEYQTYAKNLDNHGNGSVGLALNPDTATMFVTYEGENIIEIMNAKTMQYMDTVTAIGASNLADIVADNGKRKI